MDRTLSPVLSPVAITGGTINGTVIGGTTPAAVSCTTLTATGIVSCQGLQNTVGDFTSRPDADAQTILGRLRLGFISGLADNASISHYDFATSSSYALRQDSSGATVINSATGQTLRLSIANTAVLTITGTSLTAAQTTTITGTAPGTPSAGQVLIGGGELKTAGAITAGAGVSCTTVGATSTVTVTGSYFNVIRTGGTQAALQVALQGEATARVFMDASGKIEWGDGTATRDVTLYRTAANVLKTDDSFSCLGLTATSTADGAITTAGKISAKVAVPASFADLAAVQSYLASIIVPA